MAVRPSVVAATTAAAARRPSHQRIGFVCVSVTCQRCRRCRRRHRRRCCFSFDQLSQIVCSLKRICEFCSALQCSAVHVPPYCAWYRDNSATELSLYLRQFKPYCAWYRANASAPRGGGSSMCIVLPFESPLRAHDCACTLRHGRVDRGTEGVLLED